MEGLYFFALQGTLKSLLQHHSSKASILRHSAFFIVQLSHPYMTIGKPISLTGQTFVDKVMSLLFNMLSMLVITFLSRNKHLLISWLQSPSPMIFRSDQIRSVAQSCPTLDFGASQNKVCHCFPVYLPWSDEIRWHYLSFLNVEF